MKLFKGTLERTLPWLLIVCGAIGLIAAFIIMFEKIELLKNPAYVPSCNLNPVISCGSVMASDQSNAFGFPNPLIGLMGFPVVITTGVVMLLGVKLKRWYMLGLLGGTIFGLGFVHWLFFLKACTALARCAHTAWRFGQSRLSRFGTHFCTMCASNILFCQKV